jgi:hypothetical protein
MLRFGTSAVYANEKLGQSLADSKHSAITRFDHYFSIEPIDGAQLTNYDG